MRLLLDVNVLLDCLVTEADGQDRTGKAASDQVIVTRNVSDFAAAGIPAMTPEDFLNSLP